MAEQGAEDSTAPRQDSGTGEQRPHGAEPGGLTGVAEHHGGGEQVHELVSHRVRYEVGHQTGRSPNPRPRR